MYRCNRCGVKKYYKSDLENHCRSYCSNRSGSLSDVSDFFVGVAVGMIVDSAIDSIFDSSDNSSSSSDSFSGSGGDFGGGGSSDSW